MFIDLFATFARKDYEQRRERQAQGIRKAQEQGKYKGRRANTDKYKQIIKLLKAGFSHRQIIKTLKCSPSTIQKAQDWHTHKKHRPNHRQGR